MAAGERPGAPLGSWHQLCTGSASCQNVSTGAHRRASRSHSPSDSHSYSSSHSHSGNHSHRHSHRHGYSHSHRHSHSHGHRHRHRQRAIPGQEQGNRLQKGPVHLLALTLGALLALSQGATCHSLRRPRVSARPAHQGCGSRRILLPIPPKAIRTNSTNSSNLTNSTRSSSAFPPIQATRRSPSSKPSPASSHSLSASPRVRPNYPPSPDLFPH